MVGTTREDEEDEEATHAEAAGVFLFFKGKRVIVAFVNQRPRPVVAYLDPSSGR